MGQDKTEPLQSESGSRVGTMDIDDAMALVGGYRRFNILAFFVIGVSLAFTHSCSGLSYVFLARPTPHHCRLPDGVLPNSGIPTDDTNGGLTQCSKYANRSISNETTCCTDGWTYENYDGQQTFIMEWDLVCDSSLMAELTLGLFHIGGIVGEIGGTIAADRYGRRPVATVSYLLVVLFGTAMSFAQSYVTYAVLIFFLGCAASTSVLVSFTHLCELFDSTRRAVPGVGIEFLWIVGYMYVALIGWLVRDWRYVQLIMSLTSLIGLLNIFMPESPLWLLANSKVEAAEQTLQKLARYNGVKVQGKLLQQDSLLEKENNTYSDDMDRQQDDKEFSVFPDNPPEETGQERIWDLFRWPLLRKYTIISILMNMAITMVYYFLVLSTPGLGGNYYITFLTGGLVEIPANIVGIIVVKYSRRIPSCVSLTLASVSLIVVSFLPAKTAAGTDLAWLIVVAAMLGKLSITVAFAFVILYCQELFPTNLRNTSSGVGNILGRVGAMASPFAATAARSAPWLTNLILGIIAFAVAMVILLLPETCDWPLPQSVADVYRYTRGDHRRRDNPGAKELLDMKNGDP